MKLKILIFLFMLALLPSCEIQTNQAYNQMSEQKSNETEESGINEIITSAEIIVSIVEQGSPFSGQIDGYFSGVVQEGQFYHDGRDECLTYYFADIGNTQFEKIKNELEEYNNWEQETENEIQLWTINENISLQDYIGSEILFTGSFFEAHTIYHQRYIVFTIMEIK